MRESDAKEAQMIGDEDTCCTHSDDVVLEGEPEARGGEEEEDIEDSESQGTSPDAGSMTLVINWRKKEWSLDFGQDASVEALFNEVRDAFNIPVTHQKYMVPKTPMLKWPLKEPATNLSEFVGKHITLIGSPLEEVNLLDKICEKLAQRRANRLGKSSSSKAPKARRTNPQSQGNYTFLQVKPLDWLPNPERSRNLLMRLKEDRGIRLSMQKRQFTVGLLTEMEPLQHTQSSHEGVSRILGLNRNKGQVIELRLRTDAHDGYRDYKTIRNTLCHELAHNIHSEHDRHFWDLCHEIEKEVAAADWVTGGNTLGEDHRPMGVRVDDEFVEDAGGLWQGGEYKLGTNGGSSSSSAAGSSYAGWSRREILAKAAMERQKKDEESECKAEKGWKPACKRSGK